ncbi:MAG: hypothetical protein H7839_13880 [Magnetococcus sp. YQC-5]
MPIQFYTMVQFLLGLAALGMAGWAGSWGLAGFYDIPADRILDAWQNPTKPHSPDTQSWEMVLAYLERARDLEPENAGHVYRIARLVHHRALEWPPWDEKSDKLFYYAETSYKQVVKLRPSWGTAWINLALVQIQSGRVSQATSRALHVGMVLAPTSAPLQRSAMRIGFAIWPLLEQKEQQHIVSTVQRLLPGSGEYVLNQARLYGHLATIQPVVASDPVWGKRLKQMLQGKGAPNGGI